MKKLFKLLGYILLIGIPTYFFTYIDILQFESAYDLSFTYLAITIGFIVTAITIIASSGYSKILYNKQHPKDNSKTLLHDLLYKFEKTLILYSVPMILILISNIITWPTNEEIFRKLYVGLILTLVIITFPLLILQFKTMIKFIIKNAQNLT